MQNNTTGTLSLRDLYYLLFRRKASIIILLFTTLFTVTLGVFVWPETYEARAAMLVKVGKENLFIPTVPPSSQYQMVTAVGLRKEDINSEIEILKNRFTVGKAVKKLGTDFLFPKPARPETLFEKVEFQLRQIVRKMKNSIYEILYRANLVKRLSPFEKSVLAAERKLSAQNIRNSDVIEVRFKWSNPNVAKEFLESVVDLYLAHHSNVHSTSRGYDFFKTQVEVLETRLKDSEDKLRSLEKREEITSYEQQRKLLLEQVSNFKASLRNNETELAETSTRINELRAQLSSLRAAITTGFSTVCREAEKELLLQEVRLVALRARKNKLEQHIKSYLSELKKLNARDLELKRLNRHIQIDEESYKLYRRKLEEARISDVLDAKRIVNVRVIDSPQASFKPVHPRKLPIIGLGLAFGLLAGLGFALLSEHLDHSIKTAEDVEEYLDLPVLTTVPESRR